MLCNRVLIIVLVVLTTTGAWSETVSDPQKTLTILFGGGSAWADSTPPRKGTQSEFCLRSIRLSEE